MKHNKIFLLLLFTLNLLPIYAFADDEKAMPMGWGTEPAPKREARAVWLTTVGGLDWPTNKANTAEGRERQKAELCHKLDQLKAININTILLQTRIRGTVIYPSSIEPWDVSLTGQYGKDPGYDPLQFAIEEAHKRGMELHAWVVTITAYKVEQAKQMGANARLLKKPNMLKKHEGQYHLDPGEPETAEYLASICTEIVKRYDVDGIHFDYLRYPDKSGAFPDADTYKRYGNGKPKAQWRRDNITHIVRTVHQRVKALKPWVRVSSSPVGKFRDLSRYSSKGWNGYDAVSQDAQGWLREGIHDALYPMMYFKGDHFYPFAADWQENACGRPVAPGLGIYFMSPDQQDWPLSLITNELQYIRSLGLGGQCYFRTAFLLNNVKGLYDFMRLSYYAHPALTPAATWLDDVPPTEPRNVHSESLGNGMERLVWDESVDNTPEAGVRYNVYASRVEPVDVSRAENLVASALPTASYIYNAAWTKASGLHFRVTAMDRFGNESCVKSEGKTDEVVSLSLPERAKRMGCVEPDNKGQLSLPECSARYYAITDLQGHVITTGVYASTIQVASLPAGWYVVRTLMKKGQSRIVLRFWKSK